MASFWLPMAIGLGGFVGAIARHYITVAVIRVSGDAFAHVGTLTVNLAGCFAIGVMTTVAARSTSLPPLVQKCIITGILGSLTTFSTFSFETLRLLQEGRTGTAVAHIATNLIFGLLLVLLGTLAAQPFFNDASQPQGAHQPEPATTLLPAGRDDNTVPSADSPHQRR